MKDQERVLVLGTAQAGITMVRDLLARPEHLEKWPDSGTSGLAHVRPREAMTLDHDDLPALHGEPAGERRPGRPTSDDTNVGIDRGRRHG